MNSIYIIIGLITVLIIIDKKRPNIKGDLTIRGEITNISNKEFTDNKEDIIDEIDDIDVIIHNKISDDSNNIYIDNKTNIDDNVDNILTNKLFNKIKKEEKKENLYRNILHNVKELNPLKTYNSWTYIELPDKDYNLQLFYHDYTLPYYFKKCIQLMEKRAPKLIVLTPSNIKEYLPDFSLDMNYLSDIPLKLRVDYLYACILEKYGGICISPGTIIYNIDKPMEQLNNYEIITFGCNPGVMRTDNNLNYPNSYVIGSQKGSIFMKEYIRYLGLYIEKNPLYQFRISNSSDILSYLISNLNPIQFHYGIDYDGSYNSFHPITLSSYLGTNNIQFKNKGRLLFISIPYDILFKDVRLKWFLEITEKEFMESNLQIKNILNKENI